MTNPQTGPYPVLFAKNISTSYIRAQVELGNSRFNFDIGPGEVGSVPWVIAKSAGFQQLWLDGKLEVSDSYGFGTTLDELPAIGASDDPVEWEEIEGKPGEFPPAEHTRSWDDIDGKPETFPPANHSHSWAQVTGKPATFPPEIGSTASTAVAGNDARLTNSRTPTTHTHAWADITNKPTIPPAAPVAAAQADSTAEDIAGLVADFNSLLGKLRAAGIIES